ncbi:MAG: molybdenum cofactor guanylyltransferase, partial [Deferrisomatales bacterium]
MPFLEPALLHRLAEAREGVDVVVPRTALGYEPLCALYRAEGYRAFEVEIARGNLRVFGAYGGLQVHEVAEADLRAVDPHLCSFLNLNRPADLELARSLLGQGARPE